MFARFYRVLWRNLYFPYCLPAFRSESFSKIIHRWAVYHCLSGYPVYLSFPLRLLMAFLWPFKLLQLIYQATAQFGTTVAAQEQIPVHKQILQQWCIGLRYHLHPIEFYRYCLFKTERQWLIPYYLLQHEVLPLSVKLNAHQQNTTRQSAIINDKGIFAAFCSQHGLPTPQVLAIFGEEPGLPHVPEIPEQGPEVSLFMKPRIGARGEGASVWIYLGNGLYSQAGQKKGVSWSELKSQLHASTQQNGKLVQALLSNHALLTDLSLHALSVARIVTGLSPDHEVLPIVATFKMASNIRQHHCTNGLNSAIDLETGTLGPAYRYHPMLPPVDNHPVTQAQITGQQLPDWASALALACHAHQLLDQYTFIGWDIAFTNEGPILLEGNIGWDALMVQLPQQKPLGLTLFADICRQWLLKPKDNH